MKIKQRQLKISPFILPAMILKIGPLKACVMMFFFMAGNRGKHKVIEIMPEELAIVFGIDDKEAREVMDYLLEHEWIAEVDTYTSEYSKKLWQESQQYSINRSKIINACEEYNIYRFQAGLMVDDAYDKSNCLKQKLRSIKYTKEYIKNG